MGELLEISASECLLADPLVSIIMITYNHGAYLSQAIEGVVSQKCDFDIELLIGEDASSDDTFQVALQYQQRYPHLIRLIYSASNVGMIANSRRLWGAAKGKYIAYCEGDDYWCCEKKLSKQLSMILADPECGMVHSDWVVSKYENSEWNINWNSSAHKWVNPSLLDGRIFPFFYFPKNLRTCTLMIKKELVDEVEMSHFRSKCYKFGDCVFSAFITSRTKVAYLSDVTAVYRLSPNSALRSGRKARIAFLISSLEFDSDARVYFHDRSDYPIGYRWEICVGLILWSITVCDFKTIRRALRELSQAFTIKSFFIAAWESLRMRIPQWNVKKMKPKQNITR